MTTVFLAEAVGLSSENWEASSMRKEKQEQGMPLVILAVLHHQK